MHWWDTQKWDNMLAHFTLKDGKVVYPVETEGTVLDPSISVALKGMTLVEAVDMLGRRQPDCNWRMSGVAQWTPEKVSLWFTRELEMIEVIVNDGKITEINGEKCHIRHDDLDALFRVVGNKPLSREVFNQFGSIGLWSAGADITVGVGFFGDEIENDTVCFYRAKLG